VAERGSRGKAGFAGVNVAAIFGSGAGQIKDFGIKTRLLQDASSDFDKAVGFTHFAGTGVFAA
jgi:hypothetical protein